MPPFSRYAFTVLGFAICLAAPAAAQVPFWSTVQGLNLRSCPSLDCGVVGNAARGQAINVYEVRDGWARISEFEDAACLRGVSARVVSGNQECTPENGVTDGQLATWAAYNLLTCDRLQTIGARPPAPDNPAARSLTPPPAGTGAVASEETPVAALPPLVEEPNDEIIALIANSDDFELHEDALIDATRSLIDSGRCDYDDFRAQDGWVKSVRRADQPVYFIYCGGRNLSNRLYWNVETGEVSQ